MARLEPLAGEKSHFLSPLCLPPYFLSCLLPFSHDHLAGMLVHQLLDALVKGTQVLFSSETDPRRDKEMPLPGALGLQGKDFLCYNTAHFAW